jgi:hypothetical protein
MSARLTVVFYVILCLEAGIVLTFLPWVQPFGLGDWSDNYFLLYFTQKTGLTGLREMIGSGWVRGAVTGVGVVNILLALWETFNFNKTVAAMQGQMEPQSSSSRKNVVDAHRIIPDNQQ